MTELQESTQQYELHSNKKGSQPKQNKHTNVSTNQMENWDFSNFCWKDVNSWKIWFWSCVGNLFIYWAYKTILCIASYLFASKWADIDCLQVRLNLRILWNSIFTRIENWLLSLVLSGHTKRRKECLHNNTHTPIKEQKYEPFKKLFYIRCGWTNNTYTRVPPKTQNYIWGRTEDCYYRIKIALLFI